jgi:RHS repeat-associated protein
MQVVLPGTGGTVTFKYDPFGRRVQKSSRSGATNYLYDGANVLEELDSSGNALAKYTQTTNIDEPLSELRSGTTSYYEQDAVGSVSSLSNGTGVLANTYSYDSYGKLLSSSGTLTNPFEYTGREFDPETGIYEYRARYYDPSLGRFISEDPISFRGGIDFYAYGSNNPINRRDPTGLQSPCLGNTVACYHLQCAQKAFPSDRCACHCVYAADQEGCINLCKACFDSTKPLGSDEDRCKCACKVAKDASGENIDCDKVCKKRRNCDQ